METESGIEIPDHGGEPFFPQPEGPLAHPIERTPPSDGKEASKPVLPGADGFAQQTTFTVDNSQPGQTIVQPTLDTLVLEAIPIQAGIADSRRVPAHPGIGWSFFDRNMTPNEVVFGRFVLQNAKTFNRITMLMGNTGPADNTLDFGIYNGLGTVRLVSAGATAVGAGAFPPNQKTLSVPLTTLQPATLYTAAAVWSRGTVGANANYAACSWSGSGIVVQVGGSGATQVASGTFSGGSASLPADLTALAGFGANGSSQPFFLLWRQ